MANIKIRVGASLDAGALSIYQPLEKAAEKARRNIEASLNAIGKGEQKLRRTRKTEADGAVKDAERMAGEILKTESKVQDDRVKEVARAAKERVRLEKQAMREIERELAQHNAQQEKKRRGGGAIGIGRRAAISVSRGTAIGTGLGRSALETVVGLGSEYLEGIGVDLSLASHVANAQALKNQSNAIASAGYVPGAAGAQGVLQDPAKIMADIQAAGNKTATSFTEVGDALREFVAKTGDLETGRQILGGMAKLAKATNSDLVQMAEASAEVANHLGDVPNRAKAIDAVMRSIAGQGKLGALEIKDFARQMAKIASNAPRFEGDTSQTIVELGLLAQESKLKGGSANAMQAATSVMSFASDITKPTTVKHWAAAGLSPYADKGHTKLRTPEELVLEALKYSHGNLDKIGQLFPNQISRKAVSGFAAIYSETSGNDSEKIAAVHQEFERLRHGLLTQQEVTRAFGAAMTQGQSAVQLANNRLDELAGKLNDALLPAVAALAPALETLTPAIAGVIKAFGNWIDPGADENDKARRRRRDDDSLHAAEQELGTGKMDSGHLGVLKEHKAQLSGEIAEKAAKLAKDEAQYGKYGSVEGQGHFFDIFHNKADDKKYLEKERTEVAELKQHAERTNQILSAINDALVSGKVKATTPPAPPKADRSGAAGSNSEEPE